jgi:hypothetical protein
VSGKIGRVGVLSSKGKMWRMGKKLEVVLTKFRINNFNVSPKLDG